VKMRTVIRWVVDGKPATEEEYIQVKAKADNHRAHNLPAIQRGQPGYFPSCAVVFVEEPEPEPTEAADGEVKEG